MLQREKRKTEACKDKEEQPRDVYTGLFMGDGHSDNDLGFWKILDEHLSVGIPDIERI